MRAVKRLFDIGIASLALGILSPILAMIAVLIKVDSKGPVFYRDNRVGRDGGPFAMIKLRTMIVGASSMGLGRAVAKADTRITRVGRFLRAWTLDEIPQLINVLRGDMSIVGPRPATPDQMARCTPRQCRRLEVKPGMAGWAWIHGRNSIPWSERIDLDIWYVDHWSLRLDLYILARAAFLVLKRDGVYGPGGITRDIDWAPSKPTEGEARE